MRYRTYNRVTLKFISRLLCRLVRVSVLMQASGFESCWHMRSSLIKSRTHRVSFLEEEDNTRSCFNYLFLPANTNLVPWPADIFPVMAVISRPFAETWQ
jgi:hypothetical protein